MVERTRGYVGLGSVGNLGGVVTWEDEKRLLSNIRRGGRNQQQSNPEVHSVYGTKAHPELGVDICSSRRGRTG